MTLHARQVGFVEVPHLTGWVLDTDDAILDAYKLSPRRLPAHRALWEARSGRRSAWWTIWDGERFTGEILTHREAAEARVLQLLVQRSTCYATARRTAANDSSVV